MYKKNEHQLKFTDFKQAYGCSLREDDEWVKLADIIPWDAFEKRYAKLFPSKVGKPAKPFRMVLGALIIQSLKNGISDVAVVKEIMESPYLAYFVGMDDYDGKRKPFAPSLMVAFRKRITPEFVNEIIEYIAKVTSNTSEGTHTENTLIIDATCVQANIAYPTDVNLLNSSRMNLEKFIDGICEAHNAKKPRMYCKIARTDYLNFAKCKKKTAKLTRDSLRHQLNYVKRDIGYLEGLIAEYGKLSRRGMERFETIKKVYDQQLKKYQEKSKRIPNRIVSLHQPMVRPIQRGKINKPLEFGPKVSFSTDEKGITRCTRISYDCYNESEELIPLCEEYRIRTGHYPDRVLADKIYRTAKNLEFCKKNGIRLSGPALGKAKNENQVDKKTEYNDSVERIGIERKFALVKGSLGLEKIRTKREDTSKTVIMVATLAMNVYRQETPEATESVA